jgi:hypothetical protein
MLSRGPGPGRDRSPNGSPRNNMPEEPGAGVRWPRISPLTISRVHRRHAPTSGRPALVGRPKDRT